jgi:hypothetical protein
VFMAMERDGCDPTPPWLLRALAPCGVRCPFLIICFKEFAFSASLLLDRWDISNSPDSHFKTETRFLVTKFSN